MTIMQEIPRSPVKLGFLVFTLLYKRGSQMEVLQSLKHLFTDSSGKAAYKSSIRRIHFSRYVMIND